jgi:hypothetical protein
MDETFLYHTERYAAWMGILARAVHLCHRSRYVYGSVGSRREIRLLRFAQSMAALHSPFVKRGRLPQ